MEKGPGIYVTIILLLFVSNLHAQDGGSMQGLGVETNFIDGKVIRHTSKFTAPIPHLSTALDLNFVSQTYGKKHWHHLRNFPMIGVGVVYTDYGNDAVFGRCLSVYPNLRIPIIRGKNLEWTFRVGDGLGYVTKKYQRISPIDTVNTAIGSHLNDFAIFMTDLCYNVNRHWRVQFGANFMHISNADYHSPNLGVNVAGTHFGVQYFPTSSRPKPISNDIPKLKNRWLAEIRLGVGYNEANAKGNPELPTYIVSGYASKRWLGKNKFFGGIDYAYHESTYDFLKTYGINYGHEMGHAWDGTVFAGNEFLLGNVGIVTQAGYYYRLTYLKYGNDPLNEKLGVNYYLLQHEKGVVKELFLSAFLTTHMIVAEYAEFGIGAGF